jgi:hypothetical protein
MQKTKQNIWGKIYCVALSMVWKSHSISYNEYIQNHIMQMLDFLSTIAISMGTSCAPLLVDLFLLSYRFQDTCLGKKDNCERSGILYFKVNWIYKMEIITESIIVQWQNIIYIVEAGFKGLG